MSGCKINKLALGLSLGIFWGLTTFLLGLSAYFYSYGKPFVDAMATLYLGYEPSIQGSVIGGLIGFIDAFFVGWIIAWLYNMFCRCGCACCDKKAGE